VKQSILLRTIQLLTLFACLFLIASDIRAQQKHGSFDHMLESGSLKILTDPPGVYVFDQTGNYICVTPNQFPIECIHHDYHYYLVKNKARFKEEVTEGSKEGFENNFITIEAKDLNVNEVYPPDGKPIKLKLKRSANEWLYYTIPAILVLAVALVITGKRKKKQIERIPTGGGEPSTVTQLDLEGFGGQVGDIRGKRLVGRYGTYLVRKVMGEGGMSIVYEAEREGAEKGTGDAACAVKVVLPSMARSEEFRARFQREIEVYHRLVHPSIVQTYDWGDEEGVLFIVMEKIEGKPLADIMREARPPLRKSIIWTLQILRALGYAHDRRIIHRDIKPSNIFITLGENIKVLDFGIARALDAQTITGTDVALGTPQYLPPEQIDSKHVDLRADLYSLGVLLYQLLTGDLPFQGATAIELIMKQMTEIPCPPSKKNADVPSGVEAVVMKLMEKKPGDRYGSAREAAEALGAVAQQAGIVSEADIKKILH